VQDESKSTIFSPYLDSLFYRDLITNQDVIPYQ